MSNLDRTLNRTERLFALVLLLQNRPSMSSRALAKHFGVSRRTVFRDLRTLSESGVPLTFGKGGGYEILEGYQLPPLMFSAREAATLLIGTAFMKLQSDVSLRMDADQVGMKIRSVLPHELKEYIDRMEERTVLDPYWLYAVPENKEDEGRWYELSEALARQYAVILEYLVQSRNELTRRKVNPLGLVYYTDHWNLIAFDHLRGDIRNFRLDYIQTMRVLTERFTLPAGFELAEYLKERGAGSNSRRIVLRFTQDVYKWARRRIPAEIEEELVIQNETQVTFYFENLDYLSRWLIRYGTQVKVLEPATLANRIREELTRILSHYKMYETPDAGPSG